MPTIADFIIKDGKATPADHTFKVKKNDNGVSLFEDRAAGIPVAYNVIRVTTEDTQTVRKVIIDLYVPTLEAVGGTNSAGYAPAQKVAYTHRKSETFFLPQRGTLAERTDLLAFDVNLKANAAIRSIILHGDEFTG